MDKIKGRAMNDLEYWQLEAIQFGGSCGGEYLEEIGKTDLTKLTPEEWQTFIQCVCLNYHQKHSELKSCPF